MIIAFHFGSPFQKQVIYSVFRDLDISFMKEMDNGVIFEDTEDSREYWNEFGKCFLTRHKKNGFWIID